MSVFSDWMMQNNPLAYYRMNAASGFQQDSSGNGNHATFQSASPTYQVAGGIPFDGDPGFQQSATSGETSRAGMTTPPSGAFTIAMSVKLSGAAASDSAFFQYDWANVGSYRLYESASNMTFAMVDSTSTQRFRDYGSTVPRDSLWHRVVATYDGTTMRLYRDGVEGGSGTAIVNPPTLTTATASGSYRFVSAPASGVTMQVDELGVFPQAWDQATITRDFQAFRSGLSQNLGRFPNPLQPAAVLT